MLEWTNKAEKSIMNELLIVGGSIVKYADKT